MAEKFFGFFKEPSAEEKLENQARREATIQEKIEEGRTLGAKYLIISNKGIQRKETFQYAYSKEELESIRKQDDGIARIMPINKEEDIQQES